MSSDTLYHLTNKNTLDVCRASVRPCPFGGVHMSAEQWAAVGREVPTPVVKRVPWSTRFEQLQQWVAEHDAMPRVQVDDESERLLGVWLLNQKRALRGTGSGKAPTVEQQARLAALNPDWLTSTYRDSHHGLRLQEVHNFLKEYGRAPAVDAVSEKERSLANWVIKQRRAGNQFVAKELNQLVPRKSAGRKSNANLQMLRDFFELTGKAPRASAAAGSAELKLYQWVTNQRRNSKDAALLVEIDALVPRFPNMGRPTGRDR